MKDHFHRHEESTCRKERPLRYLEQKEAARTSIKAIVRSQNNLSRVLAPGTWGHPWRLVLLQNEEKLSIILNSKVLKFQYCQGRWIGSMCTFNRAQQTFWDFMA